MKEKGTAIKCQDSVDKLISVLDQNKFESGKHIYFFDV